MLKNYIPHCIKESFVQLKLLLWKNIVAEFNKSNFESLIMLFEIFWASACWSIISSVSSKHVDNTVTQYDYSNIIAEHHGINVDRTFYYPNVTFTTEIMLRVAFELHLTPLGKYVTNYRRKYQ